MSYNILAILLGWLIALAIFLGFIVLLRYIHYREHVALITHGFNPNTQVKRKRSKGILRAGLITMMVGLSLTVGLYPVSFLLPATMDAAPFHLGPWLLPGLIPLGVGIALTVSYYLEQNSTVNDDHEQKGKKVISFEERLDKERRNGSDIH
jgi:formate hydrogenlyase subunit 3/multisubunit Na+/H+ antiporter MnhD subunit